MGHQRWLRSINICGRKLSTRCHRGYRRGIQQRYQECGKYLYSGELYLELNALLISRRLTTLPQRHFITDESSYQIQTAF